MASRAAVRAKGFRISPRRGAVSWRAVSRERRHERRPAGTMGSAAGTAGANTRRASAGHAARRHIEAQFTGLETRVSSAEIRLDIMDQCLSTIEAILIRMT